ncbi:MAG TPA: DNA-3-methyladenine glycosylase 2 family protein [Usitatibacter sp.]|nr:DNA-3-methyladenine glycosylase 2 family protein [Usitatibacter sp.]
MIPPYWPDAKLHLSKRDRILRDLIKQYPDAELRTRGDAFQTLARAIVGQQISVKAAQSIWNRFAQASGKVTPPNVLVLPDAAMRSCGLSASKVAYLKDLASHFDSGAVKPRRWSRMENEAIVEDLIRVKGIGRWSVDMFLIFHLMRPDVLPVGDLGLQRAMERLYNDGAALTKNDMREIGSAWQPWSSVATWYLWRSLDPVKF